MTKSKKITTIIMGSVTAAIIILDIVLVNVVPDATISKVTLFLAHKPPLIPHAVGVLMGHLFFPQKEK